MPDASANGLQVGPRWLEIERVAVAVDGSARRSRRSRPTRPARRPPRALVGRLRPRDRPDLRPDRPTDREQPRAVRLPSPARRPSGTGLHRRRRRPARTRGTAPCSANTAPNTSASGGTAAGSYTPMNSASASRRIWIPAARPAPRVRAGRDRRRRGRYRQRVDWLDEAVDVGAGRAGDRRGERKGLPRSAGGGNPRLPRGSLCDGVRRPERWGTWSRSGPRDDLSDAPTGL